MENSEQQKSIFVTGGSGGMGLATGRLFADKGWFVGLLDIDEERLKEAKSEFVDDEKTMIRRLDVTDEEDFAGAVAAFSERTNGRMDILFSNAGIAPGAWFEEMPVEAIRRIIDINVFGAIIGTRAALPLLKNTPGSLCISTSSSCATHGHAMRAVYSASRFAVKGLTEALSLEFERFGARTGEPFDESMFDAMAKEGPYRSMPASAIAEAVWGAYHCETIRWYVPEEVGDTDRLKALDFNAAREETKEFTLATG